MIDAALSRVTGFLDKTIERYKREAAYPVPAFRITVDGNDIAQLISPAPDEPRPDRQSRHRGRST
ncbi:hypothetical protein MZE46_029035 [Pseudomonas sp. A4]|nr:hypothetical protein [Pseudomonas sp. S11A4]MCR8935652.1 hypothetical protein [Pseudomonas sp. S11A4]